MSSSGQAPNVSMDELLASIRNMIEGESTGGVSAGVDEGGNQPGGGPNGANPDALDDGIMDLTQVATPPHQHEQAGFQKVDGLQGAGEEMNAQPYPAERSIASEGTPLPGNQHEAQRRAAEAAQQRGSAKEAAAQINDILGGLTGDAASREAPHGAGDQADPMAGMLAGRQPDAGARPGIEAAAPGREMNEMERAAEHTRGVSAADPMAGFDTDGLAGLEQAAAREQKRALEAEIAAMKAAEQAEAGLRDRGQKDQAEEMRGLHGRDAEQAAGRALPPQDGAGQPPMGGMPGQLPQGDGAGRQGGPHYQPQGPGAGHALGQAHALGQGPANAQNHGHLHGHLHDHGQGHVHEKGQAEGVPYPGQQPHPQSPQAQHGQPGGGPDAALDTEFAMGQALQQADASLGAHSAMNHQLPAASPMGRGLQPLAQQMPQDHGMGHAVGHDLPVPVGGRAMVPAAQPMMMADQSADQLPVEMRNNLEEIVKQLLKPLLREWLERNLPELLRGAVDETGKIDPDRL